MDALGAHASRAAGVLLGLAAHSFCHVRRRRLLRGSYPVTEAAQPGFGLADMTQVEDDALDRCYAESGQDPTCVLATCTHI